MKKTVFLFLSILFFFSSIPSTPITAATEDPIFATVDQPHFFDIPPTQPQAGSWYYTPRALGTIVEIVVHHSGSFPYGPYNDSAMIAGYTRYHQDLHCGIYDDPDSWNSSSGLPAQEGFPDGYSGPSGWDYNFLDYHFAVGTDGIVYQGRRENTVGWHSSNWDCNLRSLGVCFVGSFDSQEPNGAQYKAGVRLVADLAYKYHITQFSRHSDYAAKSCPGYNFPWERFLADVRREAGLYPDCTYTDWFHPAAMRLGRLQYITGLPDGKLYPNAMITRAEFCTIIYRISGFPMIQYKNNFPDIRLHWAKTAIDFCTAMDYVTGYPNGLFYPDKPVTRAEAATIISRFKSLIPSMVVYFPDVPSDLWASSLINACKIAGYLTGYPDGTFQPNGLMTRAEAFQLIAKVVP